MQIQVDIGFKDLVEILKNLPEEQLVQLRRELEVLPSNLPKNEFREFLLNGPIFSDEQIKVIKKTREEINKWRVE